MPKYSQDLIQKREKFVLKLFKKNPHLSVPKANAVLKKATSHMMNAQRMYELRNVARLNASKEAGAPQVEAARGEVIPLPLQPALKFTYDDQEKGSFVQNILSALNEAHLTNLSVQDVGHCLVISKA